MIIQDEKQQFIEDEQAGVSNALHGRLIMPSTDRAKKAPVTRDVRRWSSKPNHLDLGGFDRPGVKDHYLEERINILVDINSCSQNTAVEALRASKLAYCQAASMTSATSKSL